MADSTVPVGAEEVLAGTGLRGMVGDRVVELSEPGRWYSLDCDITDAAEVGRAVAAAPGRAVVHFAAFTATDQAWAQRGDRTGSCYQVNVLGTRNVAAACKAQDRYLIHISTDYVFRGDSPDPYREQDEPRPLDWYSRTKLWAEHEVRDSGAAFAILRPSFPFRAGYRRKADVVRKILAGLSSGTLPPMFDDTLITPTFVDDLSLAIDRVARLAPASSLLHCAGSEALSPYELAVLVATEFGYPVSAARRSRLADLPAGAGRPYPRYLNVSGARAEQVLGMRFRPVRSALPLLREQRDSHPVPNGTGPSDGEP